MGGKRRVTRKNTPTITAKKISPSRIVASIELKLTHYAPRRKKKSAFGGPGVRHGRKLFALTDKIFYSPIPLTGTDGPENHMDLQRFLADDEAILYQTGKHWAVLAKAVLYLCLALALFASRESILRNIPYFAASEPAREAPRPTPVAQAPANDQRILPSQTLDDIKHYATVIVTWSATGASLLLAAVLALLGVARILGFFTRRTIITTRRIIDRDALFGALASYSLANVESARIAPGLFGPVLGYGKVVLVMTSGCKVSLANLRRPVEFERRIFSAR